MIKQKQLPRADQLLFIVGSIALTFVAIFIANGFLKGHTEPIFIEGILYAAILAVYAQTFRASRTVFLIKLSRIISYFSIVTAILIIFIINYFAATFHW